MTSLFNRTVSAVFIGAAFLGTPSLVALSAQESAQEDVLSDESSAAVEALVEAIRSALSEMPEDASSDQLQVAIEVVLDMSGEDEEVQESALYIILADAEAEGDVLLSDAVQAIIVERFPENDDDTTGGTGGIGDGGSAAIAAPASGITGGGSDY